MAEKQKERKIISKDKSITKPLTKIKTKDDEVHICYTDIHTMYPYDVQGDIIPLLSYSTPSTPEPKKSKSEPSLSEIQENIMRCNNKRVNRLEELLKARTPLELLRANMVSIEALKKTTE